MKTTYRLVSLEERGIVGQTAASPELAKLVPGDLRQGEQLLGMEQTEWVEHFDKMKVSRSILIAAEKEPGEWDIGISAINHTG